MSAFHHHNSLCLVGGEKQGRRDKGMGQRAVELKQEGVKEKEKCKPSVNICFDPF